MCTNESYVSPYLRRSRGSYAEVIRDTGVKTEGATGREGGVISIQVDDEGAASGVPKRDRRREGEARRYRIEAAGE